MIRLELSTEDAALLRQQLAYRITELDRDLVRTDQPRLQHELAGEVGRLIEIERRIATMLSEGTVA